MKRSEINNAIDYVIERMKEYKFPLPPFAYYNLQDWKKINKECEEIKDNMLGWDVTDFGKGKFEEIGLTVFVFRNGNFNDKNKYPKPYCEKLLYVKEGQILPYHFHWNKTEDIINRGGGKLEITLWQSDENEEFSKNKEIIISKDGQKLKVRPGGKIILNPGESVTLKPYQYHMWKAIEGYGDVILFEVSSTNDDNVDNRFYEVSDRIPKVEEDEEIKHLIFADYDKYL